MLFCDVSAQQGCLTPALYIEPLALKTLSREGYYHDNCGDRSKCFFLEFLFYLVWNILLLVSRRSVQCLCTEVALRHRGVNYRGVTVTVTDVGSMFCCPRTKDPFDPQTHRTRRTEVQLFPANDMSACILPAVSDASIRCKSATTPW